MALRRLYGFSTFQSTFPRGERQRFTVAKLKAGKFQSTFPRGERRRTHSITTHWYCNFNPRSRVGNDKWVLGQYTMPDDFNPRSRVGNDVNKQGLCNYYAIFQSTFPRGERLFKSIRSPTFLNFNPRSRVGNDLMGDNHVPTVDISIHVPAWGTTDRS